VLSQVVEKEYEVKKLKKMTFLPSLVMTLWRATARGFSARQLGAKALWPPRAQVPRGAPRLRGVIDFFGVLNELDIVMNVLNLWGSALQIRYIQQQNLLGGILKSCDVVTDGRGGHRMAMAAAFF